MHACVRVAACGSSATAGSSPASSSQNDTLKRLRHHSGLGTSPAYDAASSSSASTKTTPPPTNLAQDWLPQGAGVRLRLHQFIPSL